MNFEEKTLNSEVVFDGKVITVIRDDVELADGHKSFREVILHSGGVVILAKKDEKTILLVNETWLSARHIYENSGFKISFTIKDAFENSFGKTDSGIVMVK